MSSSVESQEPHKQLTDKDAFVFQGETTVLDDEQDHVLDDGATLRMQVRPKRSCRRSKYLKDFVCLCAEGTPEERKGTIRCQEPGCNAVLLSSYNLKRHIRKCHSSLHKSAGVANDRTEETGYKSARMARGEDGSSSSVGRKDPPKDQDSTVAVVASH
jgi:hypothetical protein